MRFVPITKDVSIQYWLEFIGEAADKVRGIEATLRSHVADVHYEQERVVGGKTLQATTRLYLQLGWTQLLDIDGLEFNSIIAFYRAKLNDLLAGIGVKEDFCKLQLRRENGARIVCFRPSDEKLAFTGFGRVKPGATRPCHQDFSETMVDRKPGVEFTNYKGEKQVWDGFEPLYVKVQPAEQNAEAYYLRIDVNWDELTGGIDIFVYSNEADVPQKLVAYEFNQRGGGTVTDHEQEKKNAEALDELFLRARRPSTK